jgi:hypothetical protein
MADRAEAADARVDVDVAVGSRGGGDDRRGGELAFGVLNVRPLPGYVAEMARE